MKPTTPPAGGSGTKRSPRSRAGNAMYRERSRSAPHNLYGRGDALFAKGGTPVPPPALFTYTTKRAASTAPGTQAALAARVGDRPPTP